MSNVSTTNNPATDKPAFMAFVNDAADLETLKAFANSQGWAQADINQGDIRTAAQFLKNNKSPLLLMVEIPSAGEAPALLDGLANVCDPDTKVITVGSINEYSFYCWLMDIGVFSYLLKPLTPAMLEGAYQKSLGSAAQAGSNDKKLGKVIAVMGARGGIGASTISLNLAGIFAENMKNPVALIDVDPQMGSIALTLDLEPSRGLREVMEKPDRIDSLFMERVMLKPHKNLSVMGAEEAMHETIHYHDQAPAMLLNELRGKFSLIVLDLPRRLDATNREFLKKADYVVLVAELTLLSLRDTLRLGDLLRDTLHLKPPVIVMNRIGMVKKQEMMPADFEKGVNAKIACSVPFAPDVFMQISSEIPSVKMKNNPAIKPLFDLAGLMVPSMKPRQEESQKGFSLFKSKK